MDIQSYRVAGDLIEQINDVKEKLRKLMYMRASDAISLWPNSGHSVNIPPAFTKKYIDECETFYQKELKALEKELNDL